MSASIKPPETLTTNGQITKATTPGNLVAGLQAAVTAGAPAALETVRAVAAIDPGLAPKALIASKSGPGVIIATGLAFFGTKWGLTCTSAVAATANCWTADDISMASGLVAIIVSGLSAYAMRWITSAPIAGLFTTKSKVYP